MTHSVPLYGLLKILASKCGTKMLIKIISTHFLYNCSKVCDNIIIILDIIACCHRRVNTSYSTLIDLQVIFHKEEKNTV